MTKQDAQAMVEVLRQQIEWVRVQTDLLATVAEEAKRRYRIVDVVVAEYLYPDPDLGRPAITGEPWKLLHRLLSELHDMQEWVVTPLDDSQLAAVETFLTSLGAAGPGTAEVVAAARRLDERQGKGA